MENDNYNSWRQVVGLRLRSPDFMSPRLSWKMKRLCIMPAILRLWPLIFFVTSLSPMLVSTNSSGNWSAKVAEQRLQTDSTRRVQQLTSNIPVHYLQNLVPVGTCDSVPCDGYQASAAPWDCAPASLGTPTRVVISDGSSDKDNDDVQHVLRIWICHVVVLLPRINVASAPHHVGS